MSLPEEDLTCPVCCDIFTDPVLLSCSHSFCRICLKRCWETGMRECPICRKKVSKTCPPSNLALKNVCEAVVEAKRKSIAVEDLNSCCLHGEKLKLFCLVDKQPICVVCQSSKLHKTHDCSPIEEAVLDCKDELSISLKSLQDKLEEFKRIHRTSADLFAYIKSQSEDAQKVIKSQFEELHQILKQEECARLAAVKKEEQEKIARMKDKIKELSAEVLCLTETIALIQQELKEEDMLLLRNFKDTHDRSKSIPLGSDMMGALVDVTKHLSNLKYRVWEKMLDHIDYTPVTLDPNTAHPCLILSDDLTSLHYSRQALSCPDNPERFHMSAEVVGMSSLGSGSHHWTVETESNRDWLLGVASLSVPRNCEVSARPENGFWTLCFRDGEFLAMASPPVSLTLDKLPKQIKVELDYNKGTVSFSDAVGDTLIYAFAHTFTEALFPYFYTQSSHPLRIMPQKVLVTMLRH
ncbi:zinc-binding protein A33 [Eucyclogobius newberryi]|uniref:zinc-binding protein A33 n=1 Tax=Eucyclogobius newberryi TaxID=166745 RepID=UPI003B5C255D